MLTAIEGLRRNGDATGTELFFPVDLGTAVPASTRFVLGASAVADEMYEAATVSIAR